MARFTFEEKAYDYTKAALADEPTTPKPYPSWIWFEDKGTWGAPIAPPGDRENYIWDEDSQQWVDKTSLGGSND